MKVLFLTTLPTLKACNFSEVINENSTSVFNYLDDFSDKAFRVVGVYSDNLYLVAKKSLRKV